MQKNDKNRARRFGEASDAREGITEKLVNITSNICV